MISINGRILENVYTTAQWAAITVPLADRVFGYEYDNVTDKNPVGSKLGNGISLWADLPYWQNGSGGVIEEVIPSGIDFTYAYDGEFGDNPTAYVQQSNDAGTGWYTMSAMVYIMDDGDIVALGDFTDYSGEVYRLVVKP